MKEVMKAPIFEIFKIWKNHDRIPPFLLIFLFFAVLFIIGLAFEMLNVLVWIGGFVLLIYVVLGIGFVKSKLG